MGTRGFSSEWFLGVNSLKADFEGSDPSGENTGTYEDCYEDLDWDWCDDCDEAGETATALTAMTFLCAFFELVVSSVVVCCVTPNLITGCCGILCCLLGLVFGITAPSMWFSGCMQELMDVLDDSAMRWSGSAGAPSVLLFVSAGLLLVCGIIECVSICQLQDACGKTSPPEGQPQIQIQQQPYYLPAPTVMVGGQTNVAVGAAKFDPNTGAPLPPAKFDPHTGAPLSIY